MNPLESIFLNDDLLSQTIDEQEQSDIVVFNEGSDVGGVPAIRVIDGDTGQPQRQTEEGGWEDDPDEKSWRLKDVWAPETAHHQTDKNNPDGRWNTGDIGGLHAKEILKHVLKTESIAIDSRRAQSFGAGSDEGLRDEVGLRVKGTGQTLSSFLLSQGLADTTEAADESDYLSAILGDIDRKLNPMKADPYQDLRKYKPSEASGVKKYADTYQQIRANPEEYHGVSFYARDRDSDGYAKGFGVLSTALSQGKQNVVGLLGGGAAALGKVFGDDTYAERWGDRNRLVSEFNAKLLPSQRISTLEDVDGISDFLQWSVVKGGESAPFMAALIAGSIAAPYVGAAAAAGAGTLGLGTAAASAVGSGVAATTWFAPSALLSAGEVYNQLDPDAQTAENAGYSLALGAVAGALDVLGIEAIKYAFKPSALLNKASRSAILKKVAKDKGVTAEVLEGNFKNAFAKASAEVMDAAAKAKIIEDRMGQALAQKLGQSIKVVGGAVASEGITEGLQEAITTIGSKSLNVQALFENAANGDEEAMEMVENLQDKLELLDDGSGFISAWDIAGVIDDELFESGSDLQNQIFEAAIAGGVLGGGVSVAGSTASYGINKGKVATYKALGLETDVDKLLTNTQKAFYNNRTDGTNEQQQDQLARDLNAGVALSGQGGVTVNVDKNTTASIDLAQRHNKKKKFLSKVVVDLVNQGTLPSVSDTFSAFQQGGRNLVSVPVNAVKNIANGKYLNDSRGVRLLTSSLGGLTSGYAGRAFEKARSRFTARLHHMYNVDMVTKGFAFTPGSDERTFFNFNPDNSDHRAAYSELQYTFSRLRAPKDSENPQGLGRQPSIEELKEAYKSIDPKLDPLFDTFRNSIDGKNVRLLTKLDAHLRVRTAQQLKAVNIAREREGLPPVANLPGWHFKHRGISKARAAADPDKFTKWLEGILKKNKVKDAAESAKALSRQIIEGAITDQEFSLLFGQGILGSANERTYNLAQQPGFNDWAEVDIFKTLDQASHSAARHAVHLDYFGDGNRKVGALLELARAELTEAKHDPTQVAEDLEQFASVIGKVIDAADNNYNRIQNESLARVQSNVLTYTTISGMLLASFASLPEFAAIMVGLRGSEAWNHWMSSVGKQFSSGIKRATVNIANQSRLANRPKVYSEFYEIQKEAGQPDDAEFIQRKFGSEQVFNVTSDKQGKIGEYFTSMKDLMFFVNGLQGITQVQRAVATDVGIRFIMEQLAIIQSIHPDTTDVVGWSPGGKITINPKNQAQLDAYVKLQQADIHPETLLESALIVDASPEGSKASNAAKLKMKEEVLKGVAKFVDIRIQNPGAANRPLIMQDPHFALLTQFNGFLSAVTTQLVPKIWNEEFARTWRAKTPALSYSIFGAVIAIFALNGLGNWLKEMIKHQEYLDLTESKYLSGPKNLQRAVFGSGAFGQYEKLLDILIPLYPQPGEGPLKRTTDIFTGSAGRLTGQINDLLTPAKSEDGVEQFDEFVGDALRLVPILSQATNIRNKTQQAITGTVAGDSNEREIFGVR